MKVELYLHRGLYDYDITTIKEMGETIRISNLKAVRHPGLEDKSYRPKNTVNTDKLESNIARAKSKIKELALCNQWDYFCTFTIDQNKYDRYDFEKYYKDFSKFVANYNRYCTTEEKVKYIFVPEMHKNGAWHIHGLIKGIRNKDTYINDKNHLGWYQYESKFGFISFNKIRSKEGSAKYIIKYVTKDSTKNITSLGMHSFYTSNGLEKAQLIFRGRIRLLCGWDYETPDGFCRIKDIDKRYTDYTQLIEVIE